MRRDHGQCTVCQIVMFIFQNQFKIPFQHIMDRKTVILILAAFLSGTRKKNIVVPRKYIAGSRKTRKNRPVKRPGADIFLCDGNPAEKRMEPFWFFTVPGHKIRVFRFRSCIRIFSQQLCADLVKRKLLFSVIKSFA